MYTYVYLSMYKVYQAVFSIFLVQLSNKKKKKRMK